MRTVTIVTSTALFGLALAGCDSKPSAPGSAASASAVASAASSVHAPSTAVSARVVDGVPVALAGDELAKKVVDAVNPKHDKPYAGPTGTLRGKIRIEGDPPPDTKLQFPPNCRESAATYGKLFRVGIDNGLADAMVAVTGYDGFVPASGPVMAVPIRGCAVRKRTVVMTFGQRLEVANLDKVDSYVPMLDGAPTRASIVAVPGGDSVKLYPVEAGHYMLRDQMPSGLVADVFVLKYATHDVTDLDGSYEIKGLPVGKARVDAFLPVIGKSEGKPVEIKAGDNTLDITLKFDAKKDIPGAAPSSSASAKPPQDPDHKVPR